jgi:hypothetical protein
MVESDWTIPLFLVGTAATIFFSVIKPGKKLRKLLLCLAGGFFLAGIFWPWLTKSMPWVGAFLLPLASSPWSWFLLMMGGLLISALSPAEKQWWRSSEERALADSPWVQRLPALAQDDASYITSRIVATVVGWDWRHLHETEPYILFHLRVVNASVFRVKVLGYQGALRVFSTPCALPAAMAVVELQHGDVRDLEVRQPVASATAQVLQEACRAGSKVIIGVGEFHPRVQHAEQSPAGDWIGDVAVRPERFDVVPVGAYPME